MATAVTATSAFRQRTVELGRTPRISGVAARVGLDLAVDGSP